METTMTTHKHEKSDGKIHVRRTASSPSTDPALCGKRDQTTLTSAWGFYGPEGQGFKDICLECFEVEHGPRPSDKDMREATDRVRHAITLLKQAVKLDPRSVIVLRHEINDALTGR